MAKKSITVRCYENDYNATKRQLRKLKAENIEKETIWDSEGNKGIELRADVSGRRFNSKKSDKLFKIADSVRQTVEA